MLALLFALLTLLVAQPVAANVLCRVPLQTCVGNCGSGSTTGTYDVFNGAGTDVGNTAVVTSCCGRGPGPKGVSNHIWDWAARQDGSGWNGRNYHAFSWWTSVGDLQEDSGFSFAPSACEPAGQWQNGVEYFFRFRIRAKAQILSETNNPAVSTSNKWLIAQNGAGEGSRFMIHLSNLRYNNTAGACAFLDPVVYPPTQYNKMRVYRDQGVSQCGEGVTVVPVQVGVWEHIQASVRFGSTAQLKVWWRDHTYAMPFRQDTITANVPWNLNRAAWNAGMEIGGYLSDSVFIDTGYDLMDFEIGDTFDAAWGSAGTVPSAPTTLQILLMLIIGWWR